MVDAHPPVLYLCTFFKVLVDINWSCEKSKINKNPQILSISDVNNNFKNLADMICFSFRHVILQESPLSSMCSAERFL